MTTEAGGDSPTAAQEDPPPAQLRELWARVVEDGQALVRVEAEMAGLELRENLRAGMRSLGVAAAGYGFIALAAVLLSVAGVLALAAVVGILWALLFTGVGFAALGFALVQGGKRAAAGLNLLPSRSLHRMSEDLGRLAAQARGYRPDDVARG
jgi:hypothetical protein